MKQLAVNLLGLALMLGMAGAAQAQGDADAGAGKTTVCVACHGQTGNDSVLPNVPKLGGQHQSYLFKQLVEIKAGARVVPEMTGMLTNLNEQDLADIAAYYAGQPRPLGVADAELVELGENIYRGGIAEIGVAACSACHSPTGTGNAPAVYPVVGGQLTAYLEKQLRDFRAGTRSNDESAVMRSLVERMSDREISAVSSYMSGLRWDDDS